MDVNFLTENTGDSKTAIFLIFLCEKQGKLKHTGQQVSVHLAT